MFYDAFAHTPIYALEALGFVGKGESRGRSSRRCEHARRAAISR